MTSVTVGLSNVRERIALAARHSGRDPARIRLVAVSKTQPATAVREAAACGQREFGENYLQDALPKIAELAGAGLTWHFIGALQSNKTRAVAAHFDWVHTVDRLKIARRLAAQRPAGLSPLNVCIQVAMADAPERAGVEPQRLAALAHEIAGLPGLRLRGLMGLPPVETDPQRQRLHFHKLAALQAALRRDGLAVDTLSMGMTGDLEAAIAEGATMLRVGTAIFGTRNAR